MHPGWLQRLLQPDLPTHQVASHGGRAPLRRRGHHPQQGTGILEDYYDQIKQDSLSIQ